MPTRIANLLHLFLSAFLASGTILLVSCDNNSKSRISEESSQIQCDPDNGGLSLPEDFCALVIADNLGFARHLTVSEQGHVFITLRNRTLKLGGLLALEDTDNDGRIDEIQKVNQYPGMGVRIHKDHLYYAADEAVYRYSLNPVDHKPEEPAEVLISGFPLQKSHSGKPFIIVNDDIFINIGSETNACQESDRVAGAIGIDPCQELDDHAGIWRFSADKNGQIFQRDGIRYASGIRNAYGIDWHYKDQTLYVVQHGRDQLHELWPDLYNEDDGNSLPAEELIAVKPESSHAWPYCYFDNAKQSYILAPEYGGDGEIVDRCSIYPSPVETFPAHYGPNDMLIYQHNAFPDYYRDGVFIAFHGSGYSQEKNFAYQVVFVPYQSLHGGEDWEVFADGFAGSINNVSRKEPEYRPTGLATGPDGSLYIVDSVQGKIWRLFYRPNDK